jgi:hypothetical protein
MFDIPLNIRYDFAVKGRYKGDFRYRWFISTGVTTYYKMREKYKDNYDNPHDPAIKYRDWKTESGSFKFSQVNVSFGAERKIIDKLSLQVEPYVKVPLKGVGFYNLNLISVGSFISIRYKL